MCLRDITFIQFSAACLQFFKKSTTSQTRILAFTTEGQKRTVSVLQPFAFDNFQLEHPVAIKDSV